MKSLMKLRSANGIRGGRSAKEALPELDKIIKNKMEWRAVVVTDAGNRKGRDDNPFDFTEAGECDVNSSLIGDVNNDLIRLTYILGGLPDICPEFNIDNSEQSYNSFARNKSIAYKEIIRSKEELEQYERYERQFSFEGERPVSLLIFSTRKLPEGYIKKRTVFSWQNVVEFQSSDFFGRNKYPDVCRFIVYNYTRNSELSMKRDYFKYFMCILTVALNRLPASSLQAYRLYECDIVINEAELNRLLSNQYQKLEFLRRGLQQGGSARSRYIAQMSREDKELPELKAEISMEPYIKAPNFITGNRRYPLVPKKNTDEAQAWWLEVRGIVEGYEKYIKEPQFALKNAISEAKLKGIDVNGDIPTLSAKQLMSIGELVYSAEERMAENTPKMAFHSEDYKEKFGQAEAKVRKILEVRFTRKRLVWNLVFVIILSILSFIGCLSVNIQSSTDNKQIVTGLIIVALYLAAILLSAFIALILMRRRLYGSVKEFNQTVGRYVKNIDSVKSDYDRYLSDVATVLRCRSVLKRSDINLQRDANEQQYRQKSLNTLKYKINRIKTIMYCFSFQPVIDTNCDYDEEFDIYKDSENNKAYHLRTPSRKLPIEVNESGDKINSPYEFISKFLIQRVELYDKKEMADDGGVK